MDGKIYPKILRYQSGSIRKVKMLGEGSYCVVSLDEQGNAIKLTKDVMKYYWDYEPCILREIGVMCMLQNYSYVPIIKEIYIGTRIGYSMNKYQCSLYDIISKKSTINIGVIKSNLDQFIFNLVFTLAYAQSFGILHRDVKPANILIDANCNVVLADWGLSTVKIGACKKERDKTVQTLWYRSPEQLQKKREYSNNDTIDMWSIGIIILEIISEKHGLISANDENAMIVKLTELFGYPNDHQKLVENFYITDSDSSRGDCIDIICSPSDENNVPIFCSSFVKSCLEWSPTKRFTPAKALSHPFLLQYSELINIEIKNQLFNTKIEQIYRAPGIGKINIKKITNENSLYITNRSTYFLRCLNHNSIQVPALCVLYTEKIMEYQPFPTENNAIIHLICAVYVVVYGIVFDIILNNKQVASLFPEIKLRTSEITDFFQYVIRVINFPLPIKTFVTYEEIFDDHKALKYFYKVGCTEILKSFGYIDLTDEQVFYQIIVEMKKYKYVNNNGDALLFECEINNLIILIESKQIIGQFNNSPALAQKFSFSKNEYVYDSGKILRV